MKASEIRKAVVEAFAAKEIGEEVPSLAIRTLTGVEGRGLNNALAKLVREGYLDIKGVKRAAKYIRIADKPCIVKTRAKKAKPAKSAWYEGQSKKAKRVKVEVTEKDLDVLLTIVQACGNEGVKASELYATFDAGKQVAKKAALALVKVGAIRIEGTRAQTKYVLA